MTASGAVIPFVAGLLAAGYFVAGLFFIRFWMRSRQRLFAAFGVAFWLLAANQTVTGLLNSNSPEPSLAYLLRLAAFTVIILAVLLQNASPTRPD
jgi:hypothetical protein